MTGKRATRNITHAFVLGGTGFIGSAVVEQLKAAGCKISALVHRAGLPVSGEGIKKYEGSLRDFDWKRLETDLPDVIYHFARMSGQGRKGRRWAAAENAEANRRLLAWMQTLDRPPLLVFGSGTLVYGNHDDPVDESAPLSPISYQREYADAEKPVLKFLYTGRIPVMIVRPPWIYGKGSWFRWLYWQVMQEDGMVPQFAKGSNYLSLIHRRDCAGLIRHIARSGEPGRIYNIYHHEPISQQVFARLLSEISGLPVRKLPYWHLWWSYDKATREALTFSLKVDSRHNELYRSYDFRYPDLKAGLRQVVQALRAK